MLFKKEKPLHIKIAYIISRISDPVTLFVPLGLLVIYLSEPVGFDDKLFWLVGFVMFLGILPGVILLSKLKNKKISDIDLSKRQERTPLYILLIILWAVALMIIRAFSAPQLIFAVLFAIFLNAQ